MKDVPEVDDLTDKNVVKNRELLYRLIIRYPYLYQLK